MVGKLPSNCSDYNFRVYGTFNIWSAHTDQTWEPAPIGNYDVECGLFWPGTIAFSQYMWYLAGLCALISLIGGTFLAHYGFFRPANAPPLVHGKWPIIGCFYEFWDDPAEFVKDARDKYGDVFTVRLGGFDNTIVFDTKFLRTFLFASDTHLDLLKGLLDKGLLVPVAGDSPLRQSEIEMVLHLQNMIRRKFAPRLAKSTPMFEAVLMSYVGEDNSESGVWDSGVFFPQLIARMSIRALLGEVRNPQDFIDCLDHMIPVVDACGNTMAPGWIPLFFRIFPHHRQFRRLLAPIIEQRREWQAQNPKGWMKEHGLNDLLSMYLDMYPSGATFGNLSQASIMKAILITLVGSFFAALGNSTYAIEGTMINLLLRKDFYNSACDDVAQAFRSDRSNFPFLTACFKEYLRLYPGAMMSRKVLKAVELPGPDKYVIPKNTLVSIVPAVLMSDPKLFEEPEVYNPYRVFTESYKEAEKDLMFLGFGHGTHKCPGILMAMNEINVSIGSVLRNYELELLDPHPGVCKLRSTTSRLKKSVRIRYQRRTVKLGE